MKKHLLFIPDFFLVMLILFSCERIDLTEWRNSTDSFPYSDENTTNFQQVILDSANSNSDAEIWKNNLAEYKERAKFIIGNFRFRIADN